MKYYVYIHIRNDTNKPFYIGKGTVQKSGKLFARAYHTSNRNTYWKNIVKNTTYEIIIYERFETELGALNCEKDLIEKYGIKYNNTGILCNVKESGFSQICTNEQKINFEKKVHKYNFDGNYVESYKSYVEAALNNNTRVSDIGRCVKGFKRSIAGFQWSNELHSSISPIKSKKTVNKPILQFDLNDNYIKEWYSITEASNVLNISRTAITNCLLGITKTSSGFIWKFKINSNHV